MRSATNASIDQVCYFQHNHEQPEVEGEVVPEYYDSATPSTMMKPASTATETCRCARAATLPGVICQLEHCTELSRVHVICTYWYARGMLATK